MQSSKMLAVAPWAGRQGQASSTKFDAGQKTGGRRELDARIASALGFSYNEWTRVVCKQKNGQTRVGQLAQNRLITDHLVRL